MEWLLFILIANIVCGFIMNAQTQGGDSVIPGVEYQQQLNQTGNLTDYEEMINATELVESIQPPASAWEYVIATYTALYNFFRMISWLWDGFPQMLDYWAGYIPSYGGITIFTQLGNILRIISLFMFATVVLEFTRGVTILP